MCPRLSHQYFWCSVLRRMWALLLLWEKYSNLILFSAEFIFSILKRMLFFVLFCWPFYLNHSAQLPLSLVSFSVVWLLISEEVLITSALASQCVAFQNLITYQRPDCDIKYWNNPGAFNGPGLVKDKDADNFLGWLSVLVGAGFSFQGMELVAV